MAYHPTIEILSQLGTKIQSFSQNEGLKNEGIGQKTKDDYQKGYCSGVCLDWLRRVLCRVARMSPGEKPGTTPPSPKLSDNFGTTNLGEIDKHKAARGAYEQNLERIHSLPGGHDKAARIERMAQAQGIMSKLKADSASYADSLKEARAKSGSQVIEAYTKGLEQLGVSFDVQNGVVKVTQCPPEMMARVKDLREALLASMAKAQNTLAPREGHQAGFAGRTTVSWVGYRSDDRAKFLDGKHEKKGKFGDMRVLAARGCMHTEYEDPIDFISKCLNIKVFNTETGMILSLHLDKKAENSSAWERGPGHSIAIHYQDPNTWAVFDPNHGVFGFRNRAKMTCFVAGLIDLVYRTDTMRPSELHKGGECTVFADKSYEDRIGDIFLAGGMKEVWEADKSTASCSSEQAQMSKDHYTALRKKVVQALRTLAERELAAAQNLYTDTKARILKGQKPDPNEYIDKHNRALAFWKLARDVGEGGMSLTDAQKISSAFKGEKLERTVNFWGTV